MCFPFSLQIYYYVVMSHALKEVNKDLKLQLRMVCVCVCVQYIRSIGGVEFDVIVPLDCSPAGTC